MTTEVIILAQGNQKRLGLQYGHKQMLRLPHCGGGGIGILHRTLCQIARLWPDVSVTIVGWPAITEPLLELAFPFGLSAVALPDPGNSSLKGIARYLESTRARPSTPPGPDANRSPHHTVVLLGDVVYSWACLGAIWQMTASYGFVGTPDLSEGGGELWGLGWALSHEDAVLGDLRDALLRHPPFEDEYQPGQLRRWLMGWRKGPIAERVRRLQQADLYAPIADYTMDVDLPHHIPLLDPTSRMAAADDAVHGLSWSMP